MIALRGAAARSETARQLGALGDTLGA